MKGLRAMWEAWLSVPGRQTACAGDTYHAHSRRDTAHTVAALDKRLDALETRLAQRRTNVVRAEAESIPREPD
jgi:hypothetical protein